MFTISAIAISWICWLPLVASDRQIGHVSPSVAPLLIMLGTFGPLFAAVSMVARVSGFRGLATFMGQALRWRVGVQWYLMALAAPALIRIVVLYVHVLKGASFPDLSDTSRWLAIPGTFIAVLLIGGPTGEEFGWRGFLLPRIDDEEPGDGQQDAEPAPSLRLGHPAIHCHPRGHDDRPRQVVAQPLASR